MGPVAELKKLTHAIEYSPNCPSKYLVRLVGNGQIILDNRPPGKTDDILGYGKTLAQAAKAALLKKKKGDANELKRPMCIDGVSLCEPCKKPAGHCMA